jgi:hypothetical protein
MFVSILNPCARERNASLPSVTATIDGACGASLTAADRELTVEVIRASGGQNYCVNERKARIATVHIESDVAIGANNDITGLELLELVPLDPRDCTAEARRN